MELFTKIKMTPLPKKNVAPQRDIDWEKDFDEKFNYDFGKRDWINLKSFIQKLLSQVIEDIVPPEKGPSWRIRTTAQNDGWNAARTYSLERSKKWVKKI